MSEKNKGYSFKKLFFRDVESDNKEKTISENSQKEGDSSVYKNAPMSVVNADQMLVEDFVQRLQNLINQNNQSGFDFLEFTETLFEEKQNPNPEVYKTVFRIAQKIDKSLTPARLLESAMFYKNLVQSTAEAEVSKGESKKNALQEEKDTEKKNLENNLKSTRTKIQQLTKQIQELQSQEVEMNNQLLAVDQKYSNQFVDIDKKITAIRIAKEEVLVSIVDIEAGIKSNLS
ncbi:MAG TPA: hypothetical protein DIW31_03370 [Bacteroidales bacterium]|nr:hypothetical protein [Bacteroidales bacterium]